MENIEQKITDINNKIDGIESTINELVEQITKGFSATNIKIDSLREDSKLGFKKVDTTMDDVLEALKKLRHVTRFEEEYNDSVKFPSKKGEA